MPLIAALVTDSESRVRLHEAARAQAVIRFYARSSELVASLKEGRPDAFIIELGRAHDISAALLIRRLHERIRRVPVTAYCRLNTHISQDILDAAKAGVNALLIHGIDDTALAMQAALASAEDDSTATMLLRELGTLVSRRMRPVVAHCVQHARRTLTAEQLARSFDMHRNTLCRRLTSDGLPQPGALISWGRLLVAARLMEDLERPVEAIAFELELSSRSALRNMLKLYTRLRPTEVRERGGLTYMIQVFVNNVRGLQQARLVP